MEERIRRYLSGMLHSGKEKKHWLVTFLSLALAVVLTTSTILTLTGVAVTEERAGEVGIVTEKVEPDEAVLSDETTQDVNAVGAGEVSEENMLAAGPEEALLTGNENTASLDLMQAEEVSTAEENYVEAASAENDEAVSDSVSDPEAANDSADDSAGTAAESSANDNSESAGDASSQAGMAAESEQTSENAEAAALYPAAVFSGETDTLQVVVEADEGTFPAGTTMSVTPVEAASVEEAVSEAVDGTVARVDAVDISFYDVSGQKVEPLQNVRVAIQTKVVSEYKDPQVVHVADNGTAEVMELVEPGVMGGISALANETYENDAAAHDEATTDGNDAAGQNGADANIAFETASFSVYAVVYTVDFHADDYTYSITGGSSISLSELFRALSIVKPVSDVESVSFSNEELVKVIPLTEDATAGQLKEAWDLHPEYSAETTPEQIAEWDAKAYTAPDWVLFSLRAFQTEETLTVTMKDGEFFTIKVTDSQSSDPFGLENKVYVITANNNRYSLKAAEQPDYYGHTVMQAQTPSGDTINHWIFEYDHNAFDGQGGYYIRSEMNEKYLNADNDGNLTFADVKYEADVTEPNQKTATPFTIYHDQLKMEYRFSTDKNGEKGFLTFAGGNPNVFGIVNGQSENNLLSLRDPQQPSSVPGTVGTWDIKGDGIVLKLFNYSGYLRDDKFVIDGYDRRGRPYGHWEKAPIDGSWAPSGDLNNLREGTGINNNRSLLFSGSGLSGTDEEFNNFTGTRPDGTRYYSGYTNPDIVNYNLGKDGFPVLQGRNIIDGTRDEQEGGSLAYLFDDNPINGAKEVFLGENAEGLAGLLRKDEKGYYYYSSEDNYARLDGDEVIVYSDTYEKNISDNTDVKTRKIGLFPFNDYDSTKKEEKGPNGSVYDHQFGMSLGGKFVYPKNGLIPDTGEQMKFTFSGDDDVWLFIDGVLVLDLGGVHQPIRGEVNFATGAVTIWEYGNNGVEYISTQKSTTIDAMFQKASTEAHETKTFNRDDFSTHTFDFFYLERGGCDSNCSISFNMLMMKTLTVAKKLNGLTPTEREKYLQDEFLYEIGLKHNKEGINFEATDEDSYWDDPDAWRTGFETYNTPVTDKINPQRNHTVRTLPSGGQVSGEPISDGQIRLKAGESMTITNLPRTDIFYLAEEDELDMAQFETPHAERLYQSTHDQRKQEEEVHLHEDTAAGGDKTADWETRPYALEDTERLVYTNTLKEKNLDVEKVWNDGNASNRPDHVNFKLVATVDGQPYQAVTGHSTINAQWTETVNGVTITRTEDVINGNEDDYPYTLNANNGWRISFEHLPKMTESATGTGKEIIYSVVEEPLNSYTVEYDGPNDTDLAYLDLFKFWPDDNSEHTGENAEHIYAYVRRNDGMYVTATRNTNGEYVYMGFVEPNQDGTPPQNATPILLTAKDQLQGNPTYHANMSTDDQYAMFDYAARIGDVPLKGGTEEAPETYSYSLVEPTDEDTTTTGLVMFTRPKQEIEIRNIKDQIEVCKEWLDENENPIKPDGMLWDAEAMKEIKYTVYQLKHEHEWIVYDAAEDKWKPVQGEGWYVDTKPTVDQPGLIRRVCRFESCSHFTETREITLEQYRNNQQDNDNAWTEISVSYPTGGSRKEVTKKDLTEAILLSDLDLSGLGVKNDSTGDTLFKFGDQRTLEMKDENLVMGENDLWHAVIENTPFKDGSGAVYKYYVVENTPQAPSQDYLISYDGQCQGMDRGGCTTISNQLRPPEITIIKTDSETEEKIGGAVFTIQSGSQNLLFVSRDGKLELAEAETGTEPVAGTEQAETEQPKAEFTVPAEGITVCGLGPGTYSLVEQSAPDGYLITNKTTTFTISGRTVKANDIVLDDKTIRVSNTPGPELPAAGGPGTRSFMILGTILIAGAGAVLWRRWRAV